MTRLSSLTSRNALIALHDALATAAALFVALLSALRGRTGFLRAPAAAAADPALFHRVQRRGLLRLQPDHHEMAFHFAAGRAQHPARRHGADARAAGARLHLHRAQRPRHLLRRQDHHHPVLVPRNIVPQRVALCLPLFSLHEGPPPCPHRRRLAGASGRPRRRRRGVAARDRERRGHQRLAGRRAVAVDGRSRPVDPQYSGARRHRRHR